jgi:hypothetical protein
VLIGNDPAKLGVVWRESRARVGLSSFACRRCYGQITSCKARSGFHPQDPEQIDRCPNRTAVALANQAKPMCRCTRPAH